MKQPSCVTTAPRRSSATPPHAAARARQACILLAIAGVLAAPVEALAGGAILFVGKVGAPERAAIRETIEATASKLGSSFTEATLPGGDVDAITACLQLDRPSACVGRVLRPHAIEQLAVVQVAAERGEDGKPQLVITQQVIVPSADVVVVHRRTCEQCDDRGLRHHVAALTTKLLQDAASGAARTLLAISSTPPGAWISLDGDNVGATNTTVPTFPGRHTVMLRAPGYGTEVRDVDAREGETTAVDVTLRPVDGAPAPPTARPARRSRAGAWALVTGGGAAVIAGAVLIGLDEDVALAGPQPATYRDTALPGIVIGGVGLAAAGVGVALLLRGPAAPATGPRVSVSSAGVALGWAGAF